MTKVKLRLKPISSGRQTLYLDIYPPIIHPETGKPTRRDFLGLYIFEKPKTLTDKQHNKETLLLADNIKAKRQLEIQSGDYGFLISKKAPVSFFGFYKSLVDKQRPGTSNHTNWYHSYTTFIGFAEANINLDQIDEGFCNNYKEYLLTAYINKTHKKTLSQNTASIYFDVFKKILRVSYKLELIKKDLNSKIKAIPRADSQREYLSIEELQLLSQTACTLPILKKAGLFSALTGLRFSDLKKLVWSEIKYSQAEGYYISFRQKKTKGVETLPISEQAYKLLGEREQPEEVVFLNLNYHGGLGMHLERWIKAAGITKHITFHSFRHTFATLQLSLGTDIYTVSKMLGHRELKTTQIYAKIIDKSKREAANRIKLDL
ncbi:tyrosine-type recombinase/integrase [Adhaeribacter pallidiroseus]|nr:site-specific integrase [Adhaeribacter pallidiroseus]